MDMLHTSHNMMRTHTTATHIANQDPTSNKYQYTKVQQLQ
jgi:hypothetical protein